jgi:hypothetical protein
MATEPERKTSLRYLDSAAVEPSWGRETVASPPNEREKTDVSKQDRSNLSYLNVVANPVRPAPETKSLTRVKAVVSSIEDAMARLSCHLPQGNTEVEVPVSLIPTKSARFGAPVWISVGTTDGLRRLNVAERHEIDCLDSPNDIKEIDAWLANGD